MNVKAFEKDGTFEEYSVDRGAYGKTQNAEIETKNLSLNSGWDWNVNYDI